MLFRRAASKERRLLRRLSALGSQLLILCPLKDAPLVSIIALCFNHAPFLAEALDSILAQTYPNIEVWLVDDASTDGSAEILRAYAARHPDWHLRLRSENGGNCRAFNEAFRQCQGEFVVDFATDDVLLPARLSQQVAAFARLDASYGVVYSNAELIDEAGALLGRHHRPDAAGRLHPRPATGRVFADVLARYFISSPTMLMRHACLLALGGYDERLAYEDFDFWVRASRDWQFFYLDEVTTRKRRHPRSLGARAYRRHDPLLLSTLAVCEKALALCRTRPERAALGRRLRWELTQALRYRHWPGTRRALVLLARLAALRSWWS